MSIRKYKPTSPGLRNDGFTFEEMAAKTPKSPLQ